MKKCFSVFIFSFIFFVFGYSYARAETILDVHPNGSNFTSVTWGWGTFTTDDKVAVSYTPSTNQKICEVKHLITRGSNTTGNLILSVYSGGTKPENGSFIDQKVVPSANVPTSLTSPLPYTSFVFDPCLNLTAGNTYYFVWTTSHYSIGAYFSYYRNSSEYDNLSRWYYVTYGSPYDWAQNSGTEWAVTLEGPDTKEPVLIVPGIAGTELYDGDNLAWANLSEMFTDIGDEFLRDSLMLDSNGNSVKQIEAKNVIQSIFNVPLLNVRIFVDLNNDLIDNGYVINQDLFYFPYDWRLNLDGTKDLLNQKIEQIKSQTGYSKVNIIAHSMGGLVTKDYIDTYGKDSIDKLIFIGTPHEGAPKAAKVLLAGDNFSIPWLNSDRIKEIASNAPAVYELLPNQNYFNLYPGYINTPDGGDLNYQNSKSFLLDQYLNSTAINLTEDFFSKNVDNIDFSGVDTYNIVGCKAGTQARYIFKKDSSNIVSVQYVSGDKTVPMKSADSLNIPASNKFYLKNGDHGQLPSQSDVRQAVLNILSGNPVNPQGNLSSSSSFCSFSGKNMAWRSPVAVHIYDSEGHHTGPIEGGIEYGIPGVDYEIINGEKFIFLPTDDGQTYQIVGQGLANSTFDLLISENNNGEISSTEVFNDVPITDASIIDFSVSASTSDNLINVDSRNIPADAQINGDESLDVTPPETSIAIDAQSGQNAWYLSDAEITLSATDDQSDVLKTMYSIDDGVGFVEYTGPFTINTEGIINLKYFSIDKAGNDESQKTEIIKIDKTAPEISLKYNLSDEAFIFDTNGGTISCSDTECVATDQAGNKTKLNFTKIQNGYFDAVQLNTISYSSIITIFPKITFNVRLFEKFGELRDFDQTFAIQDIERVKINYFFNKDQSTITKTDANLGSTQETLNRKTFLQLITDKGKINYKYE